MTITTQPSALSLLGNLAPITITAAETDVTMQLDLYDTGSTILTHSYTPTANGTIEIQLKDIIRPLLTFDLRDTATPYRQADIIHAFRVTLTPTTTTDVPATPTTIDFSVIRAGIDRFDGDAASFLTQNFLTWQPTTKRVTYYTPEFLTYYAPTAANIKCKAYIPGNSGQSGQSGDSGQSGEAGQAVTFTLHTIPLGQCHTIPVQYATILAALRAVEPSSPAPAYYDVWVENSQGERLSYIQRYVADTMRTDEEQWVLFENSLGGIDTFRAYGDSENTAEHTHNIAEVEETLTEYRVDTERKHRKNTGHLNAHERLWLLDFFPSTRKYIYLPTSPISPILPIIVTESDVTYNAATHPPAYTFTYRYAQDRPLLNLPRADAPQEVLDITLPADEASFTLAPRLAEFPRLMLSGGALFPIQSPYSQAWAATSLAALADYIIQNITTQSTQGGIGHTHNNIALLNLLSYIDGYLSVGAEKTKAGRADIATRAEDLTDDSPAYDRFLRKDIADTAAHLITLLEGSIHGDPESPEAVIGSATLPDIPDYPDIPEIPGSTDTPTSYIRSLLAPYLRANALAANTANANDITTHDLTVTGMAHFFQLVIDKIRATAGAQIITPATGFKIADVLPIDCPDPRVTGDPGQSGNSGESGQSGESWEGETIDGLRLFFRSQDTDGNAIQNLWLVGDQALCRSFNEATPGVHYQTSNKYYWALVCGTDNNGDGTSTPVIREVDGTAVPCHYIDIYCGTGNEIPEERPTDADGTPLWDGDPTRAAAGDEVAMLGYRLQAADRASQQSLQAARDRQAAIYLSAYASTDHELRPPFIAFYQGVDNFNLASHRKTYSDARGTTLYGTFISTSSEQETQIEAMLSGTEFDIIFGEGTPTDPPDTATANTLYYDTLRTPGSTGGRLWKWEEVSGTWQWVQVTDADTLAALEQVAATNSKIEQLKDQINLQVVSDGVEVAGVHINGTTKHVTIIGERTSIEGDLDIKGLITESSRFIDWWSPDFSVGISGNSGSSGQSGQSGQSGNGEPSQDPSDYADTALFIPIDMQTVKSVSISPTARQSDGSGNPLHGAMAIVALPLHGNTTINNAVSIRGHQLSGTHITIRNAYSPFYAHWQQLQGSHKFDAVNGAVLICADPRILNAANYGAASAGVGGQSAATIPIAEGSYSESMAHGNIIANGRRAKFLLLMPGQSVELVSSVEQYGTDINGTYGTVPYLAWYVTGDSHQPVAAQLTIEGTNANGDAINHEATFDPTVTQIGESDPHAGGAFLAPPQMAALANGDKIEITIVTDHGHRPHS